MATPTSLRIPEQLRARLNKAAKKSNTPASDIILAGLVRFLDGHRTPDEIITAVIQDRRKGAA